MIVINKGNLKVLLIPSIFEVNFTKMCFQLSCNYTLDYVAKATGTIPVPHIAWQPCEHSLVGAALPVITNEYPKVLQVYQWGLVPSWASHPTMRNMYNTKVTNMATKPSLQAIACYRRCAIPVSGFAVKHATRGTAKAYYATHNKPLLLAGIWELYGEGLLTFSVLTQATDNHELLHMPIILSTRTQSFWLQKQPITVKELLHFTAG